MEQTFIIHGRLPGLNEYTRECRGNKYGGNRCKRVAEKDILIAIQLAKLQPVTRPVRLKYNWVEPNNRRDRDNIAMGQKFVQDALVKAGILPDDSAQWVRGFSHCFGDPDPKHPEIVVTIQELEP